MANGVRMTKEAYDQLLRERKDLCDEVCREAERADRYARELDAANLKLRKMMAEVNVEMRRTIDLGNTVDDRFSSVDKRFTNAWCAMCVLAILMIFVVSAFYIDMEGVKAQVKFNSFTAGRAQ
jgi:hypothetical protein